MPARGHRATRVRRARCATRATRATRARREQDAHNDDRAPEPLHERRALAEEEPGRGETGDGHEHRERCDGPGRVTGHEPGPDSGADDGRDEARVGEPGDGECADRRADRGDRVRDPLRALDCEAERQHWNGRHDAHPHREPDRLGRPGAAHGEVAQGPAEPAQHGEDERPHRRHVAPLRADDAEAEQRDEHPECAPGRQVLSEQGPEDDREGRRALEDERGETGRHTGGHAPVEEGELEDAETQAVEQDPAPGHVGSRHEEECGEREGRPAQGDGEERRELLE